MLPGVTCGGWQLIIWDTGEREGTEMDVRIVKRKFMKVYVDSRDYELNIRL